MCPYNRVTDLHVMITTRALMANLSHVVQLSIDATFKTNDNGFPVCQIGLQDRNRHWFLGSFHIIWKPEDTNVSSSIA